MTASLVAAGVIGMPLVMAIGLFLILRMGKEDTEKDETEVSEER
jgi:MFS-type transporter involved in bile tolerance (Atg22 family)